MYSVAYVVGNRGDSKRKIGKRDGKKNMVKNRDLKNIKKPLPLDHFSKF